MSKKIPAPKGNILFRVLTAPATQVFLGFVLFFYVVSGKVFAQPVIDEDQLPNISNAKLTDMTGWTVKLRNSASTGDPEDKLVTELTEQGSPTNGWIIYAEDADSALKKVQITNLPAGTHTGDVTGSAVLTIAAGAVGADELDAATDASLALADSATQPGDNVSTLTNDSGYLTSVEGTAVLSTGETSAYTFLRADGDNTSSWVAMTALTNNTEPNSTLIGSATGFDFTFGTGDDLRINASAGTSGQALTSGGSGASPTWSTFLANVSEDTSPQAGGDFDLQTNKLVGNGGSAGLEIDASGNGKFGEYLTVNGAVAAVEPLHVQETSTFGAAALFTNDTTGHTATDGLFVGYSNKAYIWNYENTGLDIATNNSVAMSIDTSGNVTVTGTIEPGSYTVAGLPTGSLGMQAVVTDGAALLTFGSTVTGGGSTNYLVWYNGSNWTVQGN